jgi:peptidoglycan/LPS O-acetylase OafA/YrhL
VTADTLTTPAPTGTATPASPEAARLGWLDALRGFAALTVVAFHLSPVVLGHHLHLAVYRHLDLGKYGVLLFFLVSGYVIPMSLERHGSLRRFWIGRLFRVYPAYLATIAVMGVLILAGATTLHGSLRADPVSGVLAHATMLPDLLGLRGVVRVFWTLSYEMTFYLVVAGLFAWRLHRHSGWWASGLALFGLAAGPWLPDGLFAADVTGRRITAAVVLVVIGVSIAAYLSGRRGATLAAGTVGIVFAVLPAVNGHPAAGSTVVASWQGVLLLAVMFAGTVVYRTQHAQLSRWAATAALLVVGGSLVVAHTARVHSIVWPVTVAAVAATFAAAFALRHRAVPRVLTWLGTISYSLYLLHVVVLMLVTLLVPHLADRALPVRALVGAAFLVLSLGAAWLSYRLVELPAQALGRRVVRALGPGGGGPDHHPACRDAHVQRR